MHVARAVSVRRLPGGDTFDAVTSGGGRLTVNITRSSHGIDLKATPGAGSGAATIGMGFAGRGDERFFGFGERANAVEQRGETVESYVADGPYQAEGALVAVLVPPPGFRARDDATYFPVPWLLSSRGYGVSRSTTPR